MEILNGPEFKEIRSICQDTIKTFGTIFLACAKDELFNLAVSNHHKQLSGILKSTNNPIPDRQGRIIASGRVSTIIPTHVHEDNHAYEQDPDARLEANIVGWREIKGLTHYGVYVIEVICSDGRPPKWVYKRFREFEKLHSTYSKIASSAKKIRLPSTSSSSALVSNSQITPTGSSSTGTKGNKFDPNFHSQRAAELQPLLTGLCARPDVFGLAKFMKWLFFEKKGDVVLLKIFQKALQKTLEVYQLTQAVYANTMIDALTWLLFFRISHIWEKIRKSLPGTQFFAVRSVQDVLLKAIRPLDNLISQINSVNALIHQTLKQSPSNLLQSVRTIDDKIEYVFKSVAAAYNAPITSCLAEIGDKLSGTFISVGQISWVKILEIYVLLQNNIEKEADEPSVASLVKGITDLFAGFRQQFVPTFEEAFLALHSSLILKFTSPALIKSFSALSDLVPHLHRFLDVLVSPKALLDIFVRLLKWKNAMEALNTSYDSTDLKPILNDLETEFEKEIKKIEVDLKMKARLFQAELKRTSPSCFVLADHIGESMLKFAKLWPRYLRKLSKSIGNNIAAQQVSTLRINWTISIRECMLLAFVRCNEYLLSKIPKLVMQFVNKALVAMFEPLSLALRNQVNLSDSVPSETECNALVIRDVPNFGSTKPVTFSDLADPHEYIATRTHDLFSKLIEQTSQATLFNPLISKWNEIKSNIALPANISEVLEQRHQTSIALESKLQVEMRYVQMTRESGQNADVRRDTVATFLTRATEIPANLSQIPVSTSPTPASVPSPPEPEFLPSFTECPVAKMLGSEAETSPSQSSSDEAIKKRGRTLTLLAHITDQNPEKELKYSQTDAPPVSFDFAVAAKEKEEGFTAQSVWAAASASRSAYRYSTRLYYHVPEEPIPVTPPQSPSPEQQRQPSPSVSKANLPRRPTLSVRAKRGSTSQATQPALSSVNAPEAPESNL